MSDTTPRPELESGIHVPSVVEQAGIDPRPPGRIWSSCVRLFLWVYGYTHRSRAKNFPPVMLTGVGKRWPCCDDPATTWLDDFEELPVLELALHPGRRARFLATRPMYIPRAMRAALDEHCEQLTTPFWESTVTERTAELLTLIRESGFTSPAPVKGGPQEIPDYGRCWWTVYRRDIGEYIALYPSRKKRDADYAALADLTLLHDAGAPSPYAAGGRMIV